VKTDTELVIEGFPGSSNSYTEALFSYNQSRPIKIAHHLHAPAQIIHACNKNLPVLVLIRNPIDGVTSFLTRQKHKFNFVNSRAVHIALKEYVKFYKRIQPYQQSFIVATFDQTTTDLSSVVEKLNTRFNTDFKSEISKSPQLSNKFTTKLSDHGREIKRVLREEINAAKHRQIRQEAEKIFQYFKNLSEEG
jgi:hypothetical protein